MTRSRWIVFVVICIAVLGGLVLLSKKDQVDTSSLDPNEIIAATETSIGDQTEGNKDAKVVLIEYADFQCPACGGAYLPLKKIQEEYKDKVLFVFRNFPLTSIHPNALAASTAAEAAGLMGKFWQMHDKLYENQDEWSTVDASQRTDLFVKYAKEISLNSDEFTANLSDKRVSEKISRDRSLAGQVQVDSTPTLFLNGTKVDSETITDVVQNDGAKLKEQLDAALKN